MTPGEPGVQDGSEAETASESGMRLSLFSFPPSPGQEADWSGASAPSSQESHTLWALLSPMILSCGPDHINHAGKEPLDGAAVIIGGQGGTKSSRV